MKEAAARKEDSEADGYYRPEYENDRTTYVMFLALIGLTMMVGFIFAEALHSLHVVSVPPFFWLFH